MSEREQRLEEALRKAHAVIQSLRTQGADRAEPVAIVGMACRFPGADGTEAYWNLLREGRSAIRPYPQERAGLLAVPVPRDEAWRGGYLDGVEQFAASFFDIAADDANAMAPLHRVLLETCWQAFESAGLAPAELRNSATGLFMGMGENEYLPATGAWEDPDRLSGAFTTGNVADYALGRVTYLLGLRGPAVSLNTGCSSSLVALHLACGSLQARECDVALAGGAQINLLPWGDRCLQQMGVLAPDGCCRAFSDQAAGFVRGEGCGVVVLKRLSDARRDGDPVLAVVRASGASNSGPRSGFTAPNAEAERELALSVLRKSGLPAGAVGYVEAHATGTRFGDAVELGALAEALAGAGYERPVLVGSVKPNIGHLEAASGVASLIKALLVLRKGEIPASLYAEPLNTLVDWSRVPLRASTATQGWPEGSTGALVCSFAMSGTNACVLVERPSQTDDSAADGGLQVLPLSARTDEELRTLAQSLRGALEGAGPLHAVAATLGAGRKHHRRRLAVVAPGTAQAAAMLDSWLAGSERPGLYPPTEARAPLAFLATGQGSQYPGMGQELYESEPAFRRVIDACDACYQAAYARSLRDVMFGQAPDGAAIHQTGLAQPALYAFECAMAALWRSWGVVPDFVMGHSLGEIAAASLAGVFSLEDGLRLAAARGALMQALPPGGAMLAAMASEARAREWMASGGLSLAAVNGPESVVLSGEDGAIAALESRLQQDGIRHRRLQVSHAFHSPLIEPALEGLRGVLAGLAFHPPAVPLVSNLTGAICTDVATPDYWLAHARNPVRFADGMAALSQAGCRSFLEIGPADTLISMGRRCLGADGQWLASSREGMPPAELLRPAQAALYAGGHPLDWQAVYAGKPRRRVGIPGYPLPRTRHWLTPGEAASTPAAAPPGEAVSAPESGPQSESAAPPQAGGSTRQVLVQIIREVSDGAVETMADEDGFFALGLDSIQWTQVHNRLQKHYDREIPISLVFTYPTLGELCDFLDGEFTPSDESAPA